MPAEALPRGDAGTRIGTNIKMNQASRDERPLKDSPFSSQNNVDV